MNEVLFLGHILLVLFFLGVAVRWGQTSLMVYVALSGVLANLFVVKQITLFTLSVTCSDVFAVAGILGLNLLQELYGKPAARKAIYASLLGLLFFVIMAQIHLLYQPSAFDRTQMAFAVILGSSLRIVAASISVYFIVQQFDILFFGWLKRFISHLPLRLMSSLFVSQTLDTVLFSFLGLYGLVASMLDVIVMSMMIKCVIIACSSPIAAFFKRFSQEGA